MGNDVGFGVPDSFLHHQRDIGYRHVLLISPPEYVIDIPSSLGSTEMVGVEMSIVASDYLDRYVIETVVESELSWEQEIIDKSQTCPQPPHKTKS